MANLLSIYKELLTPIAPVGHASSRKECLIKMTNDIFDECFIDKADNIYFHRKGCGSKVLFTAVLGNRALQVTHIEDRGFLRFIHSPASPLFSLSGKRVRFDSGATGVIGWEDEIESWNLPTINDLDCSRFYIDLGVQNLEEAKNLVSVGDYGVVINELRMLPGEILTGTYLSDLAGCATLISLFNEVSTSSNDIYFLFRQRKEIPASVRTIEPSIIVELTSAPAVNLSNKKGYQLGKGPVIYSNDSTELAFSSLKQVSKDLNICFQYGFSKNQQSCPVDACFTKLAIAVRYYGTVSELLDTRDIDSSVRLLRKTFL